MPTRTTTHRFPPRKLIFVEAVKVELEKGGPVARARAMDIWIRPFIVPKEEGLGDSSFARIILKLREL